MLRFSGMAALALLAAPVATQAQVDCPSAHREYQDAVDKIQSTFRPYARCISESSGRNTCALEFKQLERAQRKFDDAVMNIQVQCNAQRGSRVGDEPG